MVCFYPLEAWRSKKKDPETGKRPLVFKQQDGIKDLRVELACGQCIGCRLERSRQWAVRCILEASLYEKNCFITLTYNDEHLPADGSLDIREFQRFMKRLRSKYVKYEKKYDTRKQRYRRRPINPIRFFHCGEYGEKNNRPHYHAIIFNHDFEDKQYYKTSPSGEKLYRSQELESLWIDTETKESLGYSTIGEVTFNSAAYVARYIMKKVTGDEATLHYLINAETGEWVSPEYTTMSRRPGIATEWYKKYKKSVYPSDFIVMRDGRKINVPKLFDNLLGDENPDRLKKIKARRREKGLKHRDNNTPFRRRQRERIQKRKLEQLKRELEEG
jgi:hypothetical protein